MGFPIRVLKRVGKTVVRPLKPIGKAVVRPPAFLLRPLYRRLRKRSLNFWILVAVLGVSSYMFWALFPFSMTDVSTSQRDGFDGKVNGMTLGLDLKGGTHLVYEANLEEATYEDAMEGAIDIVRDRIDKYGVAEPIIQRQGDDRVLIQLPGIEDINQAKELIGQIAVLDFRELQPGGQQNIQWIKVAGEAGQESNLVTEVEPGTGTHEWVPAEAIGSDGELKHLTGEYLKPNCKARLSGALGAQPEVTIEWDSEGAILFEEITGRLYPGRDPLGIFLDGEVVSYPTVQAVLSNDGVITVGTWDQAESLEIQLNSGALPVPLGRWEGDEFLTGEPMFEDTVSATLGEEFVKWGIMAFLIGVGLVMVFMILYYRAPGVMAALALIVYAIVVLAIFKLIPVTLTLAGIGGFVLSIGMAVDANVLIFERMREELRAGRTLKASIDVGFDRAWVAILHSNVSTLIICGVLYWFGSGVVESPQVQGFALTLAIGVALSMLSAIVVTRTFLRLFTGRRMAKRKSWFGPEPKVAEP